MSINDSVTLSFQMERKTHHPQGTVTGVVELRTKHRFDFYSIFLYIKGKIILPHSIFDKSNSQLPLNKKRKTEILSQYLILKKIEGRKDLQAPVLLPPGTYCFPFQFTLQKDSIPSANYDRGKIAIKYSLIAFADQWGRTEDQIDDPWISNAHSVKIPLEVSTAPIPPRLALRPSVPVRKERTYMMGLGPLIGRQYIALEAQLERDYTWQSDRFKVRVLIDNQSLRKVTSMSVKLRQIWKYSLKAPSEEPNGEMNEKKMYTSSCQQLVDGKEYKKDFPLSSYSKLSGVVMVSVQLPQLNQPTIVNCSSLSITYSVFVRIRIAASKSFVIELPITLLSSCPTKICSTQFRNGLNELIPEEKIFKGIIQFPKKNLTSSNMLQHTNKSEMRMHDELFAVSGVDSLINALEKAHYIILVNQTQQLVAVHNPFDYRSASNDLVQRIERVEKNVNHLLHLIGSEATKLEVAQKLKELSLLQDSLLEGIFTIITFIRDLSLQQNILSSSKCILLSLYQVSIICSHTKIAIFHSLLQVSLKRFEVSMQDLKEAVYKAGLEGGKMVDQLSEYHRMLEDLTKKIASSEISKNSSDSARRTKERISESGKTMLELIYVLLSVFSIPHSKITEKVSNVLTHIFGNCQQIVADTLRYRSFRQRDEGALDYAVSKVLERLRELLGEITEFSMTNLPPTNYVQRVVVALENLLGLDSKNASFLDTQSFDSKPIFNSCIVQLSTVQYCANNSPSAPFSPEIGDEIKLDEKIFIKVEKTQTGGMLNVEKLLEQFLEPIFQIFQFWESIDFKSSNHACHSLIANGTEDLVEGLSELSELMKECDKMEKYVENKRNIIVLMERVVIRVGKLCTFLISVVDSQEEGALLKGKFDRILEKLCQTGCSAYQMEKDVREMIRKYIKEKEALENKPKSFLAPSSWTSPDIHAKNKEEIFEFDDTNSSSSLTSPSVLRKQMAAFQSQFGSFKARSTSSFSNRSSLNILSTPTFIQTPPSVRSSLNTPPSLRSSKKLQCSTSSSRSSTVKSTNVSNRSSLRVM